MQALDLMNNINTSITMNINVIILFNEYSVLLLYPLWIVIEII